MSKSAIALAHKELGVKAVTRAGPFICSMVSWCLGCFGASTMALRVRRSTLHRIGVPGILKNARYPSAIGSPLRHRLWAERNVSKSCSEQDFTEKLNAALLQWGLYAYLGGGAGACHFEKVEGPVQRFKNGCVRRRCGYPPSLLRKPEHRRSFPRQGTIRTDLVTAKNPGAL